MATAVYSNHRGYHLYQHPTHNPGHYLHYDYYDPEQEEETDVTLETPAFVYYPQLTSYSDIMIPTSNTDSYHYNLYVQQQQQQQQQYFQQPEQVVVAKKKRPTPNKFTFSDNDIKSSMGKKDFQKIPHWTEFPTPKTRVLAPSQMRKKLVRLAISNLMSRQQERKLQPQSSSNQTSPCSSTSPSPYASSPQFQSPCESSSPVECGSSPQKRPLGSPINKRRPTCFDSPKHRSINASTCSTSSGSSSNSSGTSSPEEQCRRHRPKTASQSYVEKWLQDVKQQISMKKQTLAPVASNIMSSSNIGIAPMGHSRSRSARILR